MNRTFLRNAVRLGAVSLLFSVATVAGPFAVGASPVNVGCADPTPYKWLPPGGVASSHIDATEAAAIAREKIALDAQNPGLQADLQGAKAASANPAEKQKWLSAARMGPTTNSNQTMDAACSNSGAKRGSLFDQFKNSLGGTAALAAGSTSYGSGYAWLNNLDQQGQINGYYCGPATIAEGTTTLAVGVSQQTAGSYMGTNSNGTGTTQMTNGMVHFIGQPVFGWTFYGWVQVPYSPTSSDELTFYSNVGNDISKYTAAPVAGDAYEVVNGPHLVGHPNQNIFHYFEIGGWDSNFGTPAKSIWYADSATSVWSTVPPYSWFDAWTMTVILGGRGYIW